MRSQDLISFRSFLKNLTSLKTLNELLEVQFIADLTIISCEKTTGLFAMDFLVNKTFSF